MEKFIEWLSKQIGAGMEITNEVMLEGWKRKYLNEIGLSYFGGIGWVVNGHSGNGLVCAGPYDYDSVIKAIGGEG
jgi:hypothetical protein